MSHLAPVVIIPHAAAAEGWTEAFTQLARCLENHPGLDVVVRAPGAAIEHLAQVEVGLWTDVAEHDIMWLAGGWSDPLLADLPDPARRRQLQREAMAHDIAGISPTGLWLSDSWEPGLVTVARIAGLRWIIFDSSLLADSPSRPGAVETAGRSVLGLATHTAFEMVESDGLTGLAVSASQLDATLDTHRGRITTPDRYLADHLPGPALRPNLRPSPRLPERDAYYRQLVLLIERSGDTGKGGDEVLALQSREYLEDSDLDPYPRLLEADSNLANATHRGSAWVDTEIFDWDSDGLDEILVETSAASLVVDPVAAELEVWSDRVANWPITAIEPPVGGLLIRRLTMDGEEVAPIRLTMTSRSEARSRVDLALTGQDGSRCHLALDGQALTIGIEIPVGDQVRVGPEVPIRLRHGRVRVDGGEWHPTDEPVALSGHRFRLADDEHEMVIASTRPAEMFLRPMPGLGVMAWPHWVTAGGEMYRITLTPQTASSSDPDNSEN